MRAGFDGLDAVLLLIVTAVVLAVPVIERKWFR
jgi:hypothetical protein